MRKTLNQKTPHISALRYSETTSVLTSNANTPAATMNLSLNSSTGAITGTAPNVTSDTTYNFTLRATDTAGNTTDRAFNIVVLAAPAAIYWFAGSGYGNTGSRSGTSWSHTGSVSYTHLTLPTTPYV